MQSHELVKLYYRIGEVSEIVGVQPHVLRYWETEFRSIRPQKSSKGQRVYSRRDVEKLLRVKDLLRNQGFTIAGARKRLSDAAEQPVHGAPAPPAALAAGPVAAAASAAGPIAAAASVAAASVAAASVAAASVAAANAAAPIAALAAPGAVIEGGAEHSAKGMRKALLGLRQDLIRMLDEIAAIRDQGRP